MRVAYGDSRNLGFENLSQDDGRLVCLTNRCNSYVIAFDTLGGERIRRAPGCAAFGCGMAWHDVRLFAGNHPDLDRRTLDEAPVFRETQPPVQLIRAAVDLKHVENQRLTFSRRPIKNGPNQPAT